ncbi:hypothetical protein Cmtc_63140 [Cupriavidus sp. TKC]|nr:hypothetical protein Cmtc_63140 [Cupriavidus sp. TKC]
MVFFCWRSHRECSRVVDAMAEATHAAAARRFSYERRSLLECGGDVKATLYAALRRTALVASASAIGSGIASNGGLSHRLA